MPKTNADTTSTPTAGKGPTHRLMHIDSSNPEKTFWSEIAVGWLNADGSVNLRARAGAVLLPGQDYQIRKIEPKD